MVPKLLLQPIVENALYHGIKPAARKCRLFVNVLSEGGDLVMEVRDDGVGMSESKLQALDKALAHCGDIRAESYGMCNVNDRIHILAGEEYGISVAVSYTHLDVYKRQRPTRATKRSRCLPATTNTAPWVRMASRPNASLMTLSLSRARP